VCIISDDGSDESHLRMLRDVVQHDERFVVLEHNDRVGFYHNFERALVACQAFEPSYIALADQDDEWFDDKLERAVSLLEREKASLVSSDVVVISDTGETLSTSFFRRRAPTNRSVFHLTMMNSAIGATVAFDRSLLDVALPFPPAGYRSFHDHWLARCAQTRNGYAFDPQPSMRYVQHLTNTEGFRVAPGCGRDMLRALRSHLQGHVGHYADDLALLERRYAELQLLAARAGDAFPAARALRFHRRCLGGSLTAVAEVFWVWLADHALRRRPRHEGVELRYLLATLAARSAHAHGRDAIAGAT